MGIFGDIAEGIGGVLSSAGPILAGGLAERIARGGGGGGGPIIIQGGPAPTPFSPRAGSSPLSFPVQTAAFTDLVPLLPGAMEDVRSFFGGTGNGVACEGLYRTAQRTSPVPRIMQTNPVHPERIDVWEYAGRPILYSGDLRACRRVQKLARRARGRRGGR